MVQTKNLQQHRDARAGLFSVLPALFLILAVRGYPMILAIQKSFTNWDGLKKNKFIGLDNYISILTGGEFWILLRNNLILLAYIPLQLLVGMTIAVLLYEEVLGWKFFRSLYYLPQVVSTVIIAYLFGVFFGYDGPINLLLRKAGLEMFAIEWLATGPGAMAVIILSLVWVNIGWQGILILGGMSSISPSVFEAARIDGAGYWRRLFHIIIPMLNRVIEYSCIISVIWVFTGLFSFIHSLTGGGPGYETTTIDYMIYLKAFVTGSQLGYACAVAVLLLAIILVFTRVQMTIADRLDDWGE